MIVGAHHEERMGIDDDRPAVRTSRTDARSPEYETEGEKGRAREQIADAESALERWWTD